MGFLVKKRNDFAPFYSVFHVCHKHEGVRDMAEETLGCCYEFNPSYRYHHPSRSVERLFYTLQVTEIYGEASFSYLR
ncbi:hypothetical protein QQF64_021933 [Cirrhinus molitorella]|uniref:Uncharacterized protein n=1 Tax=Cirrhinus molitorella TaxID=172907 RepID=A0ABR3L6Q8_9TELE